MATVSHERPRPRRDDRQVLRAVSSLELDRRGRRTRIALRYLGRLVALLALVGAGYLVWLAVQPILPEEEAAPPAARQAAPAEQQPAPPPPRPEGIPARIPPWAWAMHAWHATPGAERGARPAEAPARLPAWYWTWHEWRVAVEA